MTKTLMSAAFAITLGACATTGGTTATSNQQKQQVTALLKSIETGDGAAVAVIDPAHYRQHNLMAADGLAGFGELMKQVPPGSAKVSTVRVFQDGDFVFAHTDYTFFGPKIGFDVFRFENGKIVEHWDNLQETPKGPSANGHSMIDGPTQATDLEKTEANKATVTAFLNDILVKGDMSKLAGYFDGDHYVQHNPMVPDHVSGLGGALAAMAKQGIVMKYDQVHRVLGEGNFVLAISEGSFGGKPTTFYDLFRVADGKLAEHWDVIEPLLPKEQWKNTNGKF